MWSPRCGITWADARRPVPLFMLNSSSRDASLPGNDAEDVVLCPGRLRRFCLTSSLGKRCDAGDEPRISGFSELLLFAWLVLPCISQSCCHLRMPVTVVKGKFSQYSIPVFLFRIGGLLLRSGESLPESALSWFARIDVADCNCSVDTCGRSWRSNDSAS